MSPRLRSFSAQDLMRSPDPFVEDYEARSMSGPFESDEAPLFAGVCETRTLSAGLRLETSDLTALCHSHHRGILKRSLTIVLVLDGGPLDLALGKADRLAIDQGQAMVIAVPDADRIAGVYRQGQRSRCIVLQTRPDHLDDEELATRVETLIKATWIMRLPAVYCPTILARDLFAPCVEEPIGRLIEESCALSLLAQGLLSRADEEDRPIGIVSRADRRKMMQVRDRLLASPEHEHRLGVLAREAGVSVTTLKTKFYAVFGQPVFTYLRDVRLERARTGIEQEGWSVSQAAYAVGYRHLGSFSGAFRRKFGTLPSEVRRHAKVSPHP